MPNFFDQFDDPSAQGSDNFFDQFDEPAAPAAEKGPRRTSPGAELPEVTK